MFLSASPSNYRQALEGVRRKTLVHGDKTLMVEFHLDGDSVLPKHRHPHEQAGYLVSGGMRLTIGDETHDVSPGDSWCVPSNVEHGAEVFADSVAVEVFSPVREDYLADAGTG